MGLVDCIKVLRKRGTEEGYRFRKTPQADDLQPEDFPSIFIAFGTDGDKEINKRPRLKEAVLVVDYWFLSETDDPLLEAITEGHKLEDALVYPSNCSADKDVLEGHAFDCVVMKSVSLIHNKYHDRCCVSMQIKVTYKP